MENKFNHNNVNYKYSLSTYINNNSTLIINVFRRYKIYLLLERIMDINNMNFLCQYILIF